MCGKINIPFKCFLLFVSLQISNAGYSQIIQAGLKGGFNLSWVRPNDKEFRDKYDIDPVPGFNAGAVFSFKMKDRFFLNTEILYSTKGRVTTGPLDLKDKVIYRYIEVPLIYNVHFKGQLKMKNVKQFKWYVGIGPNFSYWLGGKGAIEHFEFNDYGVPEIEYKLKFGERTEEDEGESEIVYVEGAKRLQLGVNIGGGIILEPINNRKVMLDIRFELGHTWLGRAESTDYVFPESYNDNLRTRNMGLRFSLMYLLEFNTDKKVKNKGKSTKKIRRR
jgi:hypothetical protein